jgi:hypothetical protein
VRRHAADRAEKPLQAGKRRIVDQLLFHQACFLQ